MRGDFAPRMKYNFKANNTTAAILLVLNTLIKRQLTKDIIFYTISINRNYIFYF